MTFIPAHTVAVAEVAETVADMTGRQYTDGERIHTKGYYTDGDQGFDEYIYHATGRSTVELSALYLSGPGADDYFERQNRINSRYLFMRFAVGSATASHAYVPADAFSATAFGEAFRTALAAMEDDETLVCPANLTFETLVGYECDKAVRIIGNNCTIRVMTDGSDAVLRTQTGDWVEIDDLHIDGNNQNWLYGFQILNDASKVRRCHASHFRASAPGYNFSVAGSDALLEDCYAENTAYACFRFTGTSGVFRDCHAHLTRHNPSTANRWFNMDTNVGGKEFRLTNCLGTSTIAEQCNMVFDPGPNDDQSMEALYIESCTFNAPNTGAVGTYSALMKIAEVDNFYCEDLAVHMPAPRLPGSMHTFNLTGNSEAKPNWRPMTAAIRNVYSTLSPITFLGNRIEYCTVHNCDFVTDDDFFYVQNSFDRSDNCQTLEVRATRLVTNYNVLGINNPALAAPHRVIFEDVQVMATRTDAPVYFISGTPTFQRAGDYYINNVEMLAIPGAQDPSWGFTAQMRLLTSTDDDGVVTYTGIDHLPPPFTGFDGVDVGDRIRNANFRVAGDPYESIREWLWDGSAWEAWLPNGVAPDYAHMGFSEIRLYDDATDPHYVFYGGDGLLDGWRIIRQDRISGEIQAGDMAADTLEDAWAVRTSSLLFGTTESVTGERACMRAFDWWRSDTLVFSDAGTTPANPGDNVQEWHGINNAKVLSSTGPGARPPTLVAGDEIDFNPTGGTQWLYGLPGEVSFLSQFSPGATLFFVYRVRTAAPDALYALCSTNQGDSAKDGMYVTYDNRAGVTTQGIRYTFKGNPTGLGDPGDNLNDPSMFNALAVRAREDNGGIAVDVFLDNGIRSTTKSEPSTTGSPATTGFVLGGNNSSNPLWGFDGQMTELVMFDTPVNDHDIEVIQKYLVDRYKSKLNPALGPM